MKLKRSYYGTGVYTVAQAAESQMDGSDYDRGSLETVESSLRQTSEFVAKLVEHLHNKGVLQDSDILQLLSGFEVAP